MSQWFYQACFFQNSIENKIDSDGNHWPSESFHSTKTNGL